ncbi:MAG: citrate synthase family protein [Stellaceae bacterium]
MLLTAHQAADRLGIKVETLYAYVSRGRLRSVAVSGSRERRYRVEDVEALRALRGGATAATAGPDAAMPVIDSSISMIENGRLYYRGRDAVRLSDTATLEEIAALLWQHADAGGSDTGNSRPDLRQKDLDLVARCQIRLAQLAAGQPIAAPTRAAVAAAGYRILSEIVACVIARPPSPLVSPLPAHRRLARHWRLDAAGADLLRRCLVLVADHELNASTFVARCVASTGASPHAAVAAALGALSGPRHGGAAAEAEKLFRELKRQGSDPLTAMAARLARGEPVPGIGQPLYPEGDPRAAAILYALSAVAPQARRPLGRHPNVDFALAAAATALDLPPGAALGLFVIGRTVGWIAHAIEQHESGVLIRPRARYVGLRPDEVSD